MFAIGIVGGLTPYIQFYKMAAENDSGNVSGIMWGIVLLVMLSWMAYGIHIKDKILIVSNIVGSIGSALCLLGVLLYA